MQINEDPFLKYDRLITCAWKRYLYKTNLDALILKAQLHTESGLNCLAESPAGAKGLAQFMPDTWEEVKQELNYPHHVRATSPDHSIFAAAFYMDKLWKQWSAPRSDLDRYNLALASYNAGLGNILKAQKLSGGKNGYVEIISHLKDVTGESNARQTATYVAKIHDLHRVL